jgi:hypothetical protein
MVSQPRPTAARIAARVVFFSTALGLAQFALKAADSLFDLAGNFQTRAAANAACCFLDGAFGFSK